MPPFDECGFEGVPCLARSQIVVLTGVVTLGQQEISSVVVVAVRSIAHHQDTVRVYEAKCKSI